MHATPPGAVAFSHGGSNHTYVSTAIRGMGGMSGGPLCVRLDGGIYYPAGVYLGGNGQVVVRSFDSQVVTLFGRAEVSGNGGANNTGGGITQSSFASAGASSDPGAVRVTIDPPTAVASGARWGLVSNGVTRSSGAQIGSLRAGSYTLYLSTAPGFDIPVPQPVTVVGGQITDIIYTYQPNVEAPTITSATWAEGTRGSAFVYQIESSPSALSHTLFGALPAGIVFDPVLGVLSGIPQETGAFPLFLGATNAGGTGTMLCALVVRPVVANQQGTATHGTPFSLPIASSESGAGVAYNAYGLPPGLSINSSTGIVSGTPAATGVFHCLATVSRRGASASAILTITVISQELAQWRETYFGSIEGGGSSDDSADPDGDGQSNLVEFAAGTDPNDPGDIFQVLSTEKTEESFVVSVAGAQGRSYTLERCIRLGQDDWDEVAISGTLGTSGPTDLVDPQPPAGGAFYRVKVSAP